MNEELPKIPTVRVEQDKNGWFASAETDNTFGDFYYVRGKTREEVIGKLRGSIKKNPDDRWLLDNHLLKVSLEGGQ